MIVAAVILIRFFCCVKILYWYNFFFFFQNADVRAKVEVTVGLFCSFLMIFKACIISEFIQELMVLKNIRLFSGKKNAAAGTVIESSLNT